MRSLFTALALALTLSFTGCATHGVAGEACQGPGLPEGAFEQCAEGFTCTPDHSGVEGNGQSPHWDTSTCRTLCSSSVDCTAGTTCRTVPGAEYLMACQPD